MSNDKMSQKEPVSVRDLLSLVFVVSGLFGTTTAVWMLWGFWAVGLVFSVLLTFLGVSLGLSKTGRE